MLSNSLGTNLHMWDVQVTPFTTAFRLLRYDRRGHGKSGVPKGPYTMELLGRDAHRGDGRGRRPEGALVRIVDGRHGRAVARRQGAGAHRPPDPVQHLVLLRIQGHVERSHRDREKIRARRASPTAS